VRALRTDFTGYEGKYVAIDARTGEIVIADDDPRVVLRAAKGRDHVSVRGRVALHDEPQYIGYGRPRSLDRPLLGALCAYALERRVSTRIFPTTRRPTTARDLRRSPSDGSRWAGGNAGGIAMV
jgi:hypothetical protein